MPDNRSLYEQVILDHNKSPRNYREMEDPTMAVDGFNPLCGDHYKLYLRVQDGVIEDISFHGAGCAISKASASIMTAMLKGKTKAEAEAVFKKFHGMVTAEPQALLDEADLGRLAVFGGVREFPVRIKCATLAWHAMLSALDGVGKTISTE
jgi:nitrogen fixation protein NifU and related proteins